MKSKLGQPLIPLQLPDSDPSYLLNRLRSIANALVACKHNKRIEKSMGYRNEMWAAAHYILLPPHVSVAALGGMHRERADLSNGPEMCTKNTRKETRIASSYARADCCSLSLSLMFGVQSLKLLPQNSSPIVYTPLTFSKNFIQHTLKTDGKDGWHLPSLHNAYMQCRYKILGESLVHPGSNRSLRTYPLRSITDLRVPFALPASDCKIGFRWLISIEY